MQTEAAVVCKLPYLHHTPLQDQLLMGIDTPAAACLMYLCKPWWLRISRLHTNSDSALDDHGPLATLLSHKGYHSILQINEVYLCLILPMACAAIAGMLQLHSRDRSPGGWSCTCQNRCKQACSMQLAPHVPQSVGCFAGASLHPNGPVCVVHCRTLPTCSLKQHSSTLLACFTHASTRLLFFCVLCCTGSTGMCLVSPGFHCFWVEGLSPLRDSAPTTLTQEAGSMSIR